MTEPTQQPDTVAKRVGRPRVAIKKRTDSYRRHLSCPKCEHEFTYVLSGEGKSECRRVVDPSLSPTSKRREYHKRFKAKQNESKVVKDDSAEAKKERQSQHVDAYYARMLTKCLI